jgi:hypothetical protein
MSWVATAIATAALLLAPASAAADFGFLPGEEGFAVDIRADGGTAATTTGSHPYQMDIMLGFKAQSGTPFPDGDLRGLRIGMPPGLTLNPAAVPKCSSLFHIPRSSPFAETRSGESCPDASQVGTVEVESNVSDVPRRFGVFNLDPPPGVPAQIGFSPFGAPVVLDMHLRLDSSGRYALTLETTNFPQRLDLRGLELTLWGTPWGASHNGERGSCLNEREPGFPWAKCSVGTPAIFAPRAYLTMPTTCAPTLAFTARASSWQQPAEVAGEAVNRDALGQPVAVEDCGSIGFDPGAVARLTTENASSATGFSLQLSGDEDALVDPARRAPSPPRGIVVALPPGTTINPSVGAGLDVCTPGQYAAESPSSPPGAGCPNGSKIGEFRVKSPLFDEWFEGGVFLAQPDHPRTAAAGAENPFDSLVAVYLVAKLPERGIQIAVPGEILPDATTGNLTAAFDGLPQLPYSDLELRLRAGQRAFLISPPACGAAINHVELTPWAQGVEVAERTTQSVLHRGIDGGPCPDGNQPFSPDVVAGGVNSNVGSYTPYFVHLTRRDTEQEITSYSLVLPKGITGKLAGIPFCPDAAIAAARGRLGRDELAAPSCPEASRVGRTLTGYGVGAALTYAEGDIYLAGPHNGQPLSLVTINAATVGPFDLGTIVIRSAFAVDSRTAQLSIDSRASDPIPHILDGIPLHLRDIRVYMDRHQFTRNPSSCEASQLHSTLTGSGRRLGDPSDDTTATATEHFQLLNCLTLGFRPRLGLRLHGGIRRGAYPGLRAAYVTRGADDANLKRIAVTMPRSLFLAQEHIRKVCTPVQFAAESCPAGSIYGRVAAHTQLLDEPLRGEVYLRSNGGERPLPDLVASLRSGEIRIDLEGRVGPSKRGGIRVAFTEVPDAPIERFVLVMRGGRRGLLVNSVNICASPPKAAVKALGQNNRGAIFATKLRGQCKKYRRNQRRAQRRKGHRRRGGDARRTKKMTAAVSGATASVRRVR